MTHIVLSSTLPETDRARAAELYWQAFRDKLGRIMQPEKKAVSFFTRCLDPAFAICAHAPDGRLLGDAGFKTSEGALMSGGLRDVMATYGIFGGLWRGLLLGLLDRTPQDDTLLMDGIFVTPEARGQGVGTLLLTAIKERAAGMGKSGVRLDVIDTNPRARALYERHGFEAGSVSHIGPLRHLFKFQSSTTMICKTLDRQTLT
jgi:GNAT superfamily N-acetyltransferase